jgi:hypothetical protein
MAYCTVSDIAALNAMRTDGYTATTQPTLTQVGIFVDTIYAEILAILAALSVTAPATSDYLRLMNIYGAAAMAEAAQAMGDKANARDWRTERYESMKADLMKNPALSGGTSSSNTDIASVSSVSGSGDEPFYTRNGTEW